MLTLELEGNPGFVKVFNGGILAPKDYSEVFYPEYSRTSLFELADNIYEVSSNNKHYFLIVKQGAGTEFFSKEEVILSSLGISLTKNIFNDISLAETAFKNLAKGIINLLIWISDYCVIHEISDRQSLVLEKINSRSDFGEASAWATESLPHRKLKEMLKLDFNVLES